MKLDDLKEASYYFSEETTKLTRQLSLAGLAIVWIFKLDGVTEHILPDDLVFPVILLAASLVFDWIQVFVSTIIWNTFYYIHEVKGNKNPKAPYILVVPSWLFFLTKNVALVWGYIEVVKFLITKM